MTMLGAPSPTRQPLFIFHHKSEFSTLKFNYFSAEDVKKCERHLSKRAARAPTTPLTLADWKDFVSKKMEVEFGEVKTQG